MTVLFHPSQNIVGALQRNAHVTVLLFDFLIRHRHRPVIGNRGRLDQNVCLRQRFLHRLQHILRRRHRTQRNAWNRRQCNRTGNQRHLRAAEHCLPRNRITHAAAAVVRQIPHRIEGFLRRACSHGDTHTGERLFAGKFHRDIIEQHLRVRQFSFSDVLARQHSHARLNDTETVFFQRCQIILCNRIFQHRRIHRRCDQFFALRCEHHRRQHIICNTVCHFGNHIGGSRGNHDQIRCFCQ